jgi:hypothetical protein
MIPALTYDEFEDEKPEVPVLGIILPYAPGPDATFFLAANALFRQGNPCLIRSRIFTVRKI